jgi:cytochrome c biogenesis protein CcdA
VRLRERPATDLAVLGILFVVGFVLMFSIVAVFVLALVKPEIDTSPLLEVEGEILAILVGALVGFVGGRTVGHNEAHAERGVPGAGRETPGTPPDQTDSPPSA